MARRKPETIQRRSPKQGRACATVEAILEAAARIIRQGGPAALTTNRIAEVAGVSVGSLYGYFPDKSAILVALARTIFLEDEKALLEALEAAAPADGPRALIRTLIRRHAEDRLVRQSVMGHHIGLGLGAEHGDRNQIVVAQIAKRLAAGGAAMPDPARFFVATRAVLGVCRVLLEEPEGSCPPPQVLEDELVSLVDLYLGDVTGAPKPA